ncbi:MAG: hypothetical protein K8L91_11965 [Anaerolineae bacterium]|nr:hypothetical protein [Anaerolineae bacterium]
MLDNVSFIKESTRSSDGIYIQACRARQLVVEEKSPLKRTVLQQHGFPLDTFASLLRKAQIGSSADAFEKLSRRMLDHMKGTLKGEQLWAFASENLNGSQKRNNKPRTQASSKKYKEF